VSVSQTANRHH